MARYRITLDGQVPYTAEQETALDDYKKTLPSENAQKIKGIRHIRNRFLQETDHYALSDNTLTDAMKTYRKNLRDVPADYDSSKYNELLARDSDGELTHSVWTKPS
jgi:hypothetical protein